MKGCTFYYYHFEEAKGNDEWSIQSFYELCKLKFEIFEDLLIIPFYREEALNLEELIILINQKQIYVQNGQLCLIILKLIEIFKIIEQNRYPFQLSNELRDIWIINKQGFHPTNQKHSYQLVPVNLQSKNQQDTNSNFNNLMNILTVLSEKIGEDFSEYKQVEQIHSYLLKRFDLETQKKYGKTIHDGETVYSATWNTEQFFSNNSQLRKVEFRKSIILQSHLCNQNYRTIPDIYQMMLFINTNCQAYIQELLRLIEELVTPVFRFPEIQKQMFEKKQYYEEYYQLLNFKCISDNIQDFQQLEMISQNKNVISKKVGNIIKRDHKKLFTEQVMKLIQSLQ